MSEYGKGVWKHMAVELAKAVRSHEEDVLPVGNPEGLTKIILLMDTIEQDIDGLGKMEDYLAEDRVQDEHLAELLISRFEESGDIE